MTRTRWAPGVLGADAAGESSLLDPRQAEAIVRLVEVSPHVRRRYQFFVWVQSQLLPLVPHQVLVCGAYRRSTRSVGFELFHSVVLAPEVMGLLTDTEGPLMRPLAAAWVAGRGQPLLLETAQLAAEHPPLAAAWGALRQEGVALDGFSRVLLHGLARPQRPAELESLFVFAGLPADGSALARNVELVLPHLHAVWQRVVAGESEPGAAPPLPRPAPAAAAERAPPPVITARERQILAWVRDGKSNQQIGVVLGISPLTVKNHIQKILRKLGASNRAQAVAEAMARKLLEAPGRPE